MKRQETGPKVIVIGGGLAGSEACYQLAKKNIPCVLYEMRPQVKTGAHTTDRLSELVCSNSFGSLTEGSASWLLKQELTALDCFVLRTAFESAVPAGNSLAVDRDEFAKRVTSFLTDHPLIEVRREECTKIPDEGIVIVATGPLTSPSLSQSLQAILGEESLYFYDAISPIVSLESVDMAHAFWASRYDKGDPDFLNVPLTEDEYNQLVDDLEGAEKVMAHDFEEEKYFEGCMPIEVLASRGRKTLAFGPMKPVGLIDPKTGKRPYAVIQLRAENKYRTAYNWVGFQTKMKYGEQQRIFKKIPAFRNAEFLRMGSLHRNTYIDASKHLSSELFFKKSPTLFFAGQITGTEGYTESVGTGLIAGINAASTCLNSPLIKLPPETILGALIETITQPRPSVQPMNVNFGILPPPETPIRDKREKGLYFAKRSLNQLRALGVPAH